MNDSVMIMIDGNAIDLRNCFFHAQEKAWPGGLYYEMRIKDRDILTGINIEYQDRKEQIFDIQRTNWLFNYISGVLSLKWGKGPPQYWLNTISSMNVNQEEIVMRGCCSMHQREEKERGKGDIKDSEKGKR